MLEVSEQLKILIADDSATDRLILESIVKQAGHIPLGVEDGAKAIDAFSTFKPDIILLDVLMPNMGGIEAAKKIRTFCETDVVPIIFLTSLTDQESLVECLEAGGDDFIPKPYNRVVLQSKIKSFGRLRLMHSTLAEQKEQIEEHNIHLIQEQTVAKQVFDKITHGGCLDLEIIHYYMSPLAVFNGDVLVSEVGPDGNMLVLLGDFTGHGLPAAIGSLPLATTFYGMVRKGFGMTEILKEINQKLHDILPIGFFCCAICADISFKKRRIRVWNGGLPEAFLYRQQVNEYELLPSRNLPLGVLSSRDFKGESKRFELDNGDRFYMWSDGVFEARDKAGEMFGEERLHEILYQEKGRDGLFDRVLERVHQHIGSSEKDDDISLVQVEMQDIDLDKYLEDNVEHVKRGNLADWSMSFELQASSLKEFDPLPLLLNIIDEVPGLRMHRSHLYTILSELYANALDHGVLGLESSIKQEPKGFTKYYDLRKTLLANLIDGKICFTINHKADVESGGRLSIRVKDSGKGFDFSDRFTQKTSADPSGSVYSGRGLSIMDSLCESVEFFPPGNEVEVVYFWRPGDH